MLNPIKTPLEMLYEQIGITPQHFAKGGPALSPQQMQALLIIHGRTPPKFAAGGGVASKAMGAATRYGLPAYFFGPTAYDMGKNLLNKDLTHAAGNAVDLGVGLSSPAYWLPIASIWPSTMGSDDMLHDYKPAEPSILDTIGHYTLEPAAKYLFNQGNKK